MPGDGRTPEAWDAPESPIWPLAAGVLTLASGAVFGVQVLLVVAVVGVAGAIFALASGRGQP